MKKYLKNIMAFFFIVSISLLVLKTNNFDLRSVSVDSGFDSSWDSGGSSSSWDSGSSSSSSWDHDSSSSSGEPSDVNPLSFFVILLIIIIICFIITHYYIKDLEKNSMYANGIGKPRINDDVKDKLKMYSIDEMSIISLAYSTYVDIQKAWMDNDINKVKDKLSDELYNTYKMQLLTLKRKGQCNVMSDFMFLDGYIYEIDDSNDKLSISVFLNVTCKDYLIDSKTEKVLRGNKFKKWNYEYTIDFLIAKDPSDILNKCPNCGAELDSEKGSRLICPYCRTLLIRNSPTLIMTRKHMNNQR